MWTENVLGEDDMVSKPLESHRIRSHLYNCLYTQSRLVQSNWEHKEYIHLQECHLESKGENP